MHPVVMVMGVSGCGKSTIGAALAQAIGGVFLDGDDYHPQSNVDHMAAGKPLTDAMRWPWLDRLAVAVNDQRINAPTVFACSALKRSYRAHLRAAITDLQVAYLDAPFDVVTGRLDGRPDHFMPTSLLESQFAALDVPENPAIAVTIDQPIDDIVVALRGIV